MNNKYDDSEWIAEKMFGEEFDSPIIYCLVDNETKSVFCHGTYEKCNNVKMQFSQMGSKRQLLIVDYSEMSSEMKSLIPEPF